MANNLRVYYDGELDTDLDEAIENAVADLGFTRWASGYDFTRNRRDIAFEKK